MIFHNLPEHHVTGGRFDFLTVNGLGSIVDTLETYNTEYLWPVSFVEATVKFLNS